MADSNGELDPQFAAVVESFREEGVPPWHSLSVSAARQLEDELFSAGTGPEMQSVRDVEISGSGGDVPVRLYRPDAADPGTLVFYHGGGWVLGTLDSADDICRELAARSDCVVVSVDYRLAPEYPFPAAVDDALAALEWTAENAGDLGADPSRLGVAGTSAGGTLAAATALRVRDGGPDDGDRPTLDGQFLLYPVVDPRMETESYREHADRALLSRADMAWFWDLYLRSPVDARNPFAAPVLADDLSGVAPATVLTAGFDVLRDEGAAYAARLADADVSVDHDHYPALAHGFLSTTDEVDAADAAMDDLAGRIRARLG